MRLLAIAGSIRATSSNAAIVRAVARKARRGGTGERRRAADGAPPRAGAAGRARRLTVSRRPRSRTRMGRAAALRAAIALVRRGALGYSTERYATRRIGSRARVPGI